MGPTTFTRIIQMGPTHPTPTCVLPLHEAASEAAPLQGNLRYRWSPLALSKFLRWVPFRLSNWGPLGPYFIVQNKKSTYANIKANLLQPKNDRNICLLLCYHNLTRGKRSPIL